MAVQDEVILLTYVNVRALAAKTHWTEQELWRALWDAQLHHEPVVFHIITVNEDHIERGEN